MKNKIALDLNKNYIKIVTFDSFLHTNNYVNLKTFKLDTSIYTKQYFQDLKKILNNYMKEYNLKSAELYIVLPHDLDKEYINFDNIPDLKNKNIESTIKTRLKMEYNKEPFSYVWDKYKVEDAETDFDIYELLSISFPKSFLVNMAELLSINVSIKEVFIKPLILSNYIEEDAVVLDFTNDKLASYIYNKDNVYEIINFDNPSNLIDNILFDTLELDKKIQLDKYNDNELEIFKILLFKEELEEITKNLKNQEDETEVEDKKVFTNKNLSLEDKLALLSQDENKKEDATTEDINIDIEDIEDIENTKDTKDNEDINIDIEDIKGINIDIEDIEDIKDIEDVEEYYDKNNTVLDENTIFLKNIGYDITDINIDKIVDDIKTINKEDVLLELNNQSSLFAGIFQREIRRIEMAKRLRFNNFYLVCNYSNTISSNFVIKNIEKNMNIHFDNININNDNIHDEYNNYFYSIGIIDNDNSNLKSLNLKKYVKKGFDFISFGTALLLTTLTFNIALGVSNKTIVEKIDRLSSQQNEQEIIINDINNIIDNYNYELENKRQVINIVDELSGQQKWLSDILYAIPSRTPKNISIKNIDIMIDDVVIYAYAADYTSIGVFIMELENIGNVELLKVDNNNPEDVAVGRGEVLKDSAIKLDKTFTIKIKPFSSSLEVEANINNDENEELLENSIDEDFSQDDLLDEISESDNEEKEEEIKEGE